MKRERPEYIWDAVRPFLIYNILFIAIRTVLSGILEYILLNPAQETVSVSLLWRELSQIVIVGISSACAAIPLMGVGQRSIMIMRGGEEANRPGSQTAGTAVCCCRSCRLGRFPFLFF